MTDESEVSQTGKKKNREYGAWTKNMVNIATLRMAWRYKEMALGIGFWVFRVQHDSNGNKGMEQSVIKIECQALRDLCKSITIQAAEPGDRNCPRWLKLPK